MIVAGLISGTSMDGLDVAVGAFDWAAEGALELTPLMHGSVDWSADLHQRLLTVLPPAQTTAAEIDRLDTEVGQACARAVAELAADYGIELVGSHGQTIDHWIAEGRALGTLQIGQPAWIVEATGLPVVSDLRARDVAAGGHGAPLASTLDALWLAGPATRAALNLGGIANVTVIGASVTAFDTGPASCLLDVLAARTTGEPFDRDGALAAAGRVRPDLLERLLAEPYYRAAAPKSTGRELFDSAYVDRVGAGLPGLSAPDVAATLVELTAVTVADALRSFGVTEVVASGGGVRNPVLMAALARTLTPAALVTSEAYGLPTDAKEAFLVALLAFLTWHQVPGVVPGATGSRTPRVLGRLSPGDQPMHLPAPGRIARTLTIRTKG